MYEYYLCSSSIIFAFKLQKDVILYNQIKQYVLTI